MTFFQPEFAYPATAAASALLGSVYDVKSRRIPNFVTFPSILAGFALHLALGGWKQLLSSMAACFVCGGVFLIFYVAGGMGAGDVKLMAAVGSLAGMPHVAYLLVLTALSGGVMAVCLALSRGRLQQTILNVGALATHHSQEGLQPHPDLNVTNVSTLRLPYALAIASGCLLTFYFQFQ
jgi:prepilin peptidase CpaA